MRLDSNDLSNGQPIAPEFAFGKLDDEQPMALSENISPHLIWSDAPTGTRSFAILCVDPDVPSVADDVNQPGKTIPASLPRVDFFHWVMIDIPAEVTELSRGECGQGVTVGGKSSPPGPTGSRQGLNNYTQFMAGGDMQGEYFGYDGPCPPWNDERLHHYHFTVYALDVEKLDLADGFDGPSVVQAMQGHILAQASLMGTYTLNRDLASG